MFGRIELALLILAKGISGAKILALFVVTSHSHHMWNTKLLEALVDRGHHVTYLGVDEYKNPPKNITHILIKNAYDFYNDFDLTSLGELNSYENTLFYQKWEHEEAEISSKSEAVKQLKRVIKSEKFDLVMHDIACSPYLLGVVDVLGRPPIVGITAFGIPTWALDILGSPMAYSSKPYFYVPYSNHMTFLQRANNYFIHLFSFVVYWFSLRKQNEYSKKCFGEDVRPLDQILDDINIIMVNSNDGLDYTFPRVPGLIPVGGLHIQKAQPLPQELKTFLDEANEGAIYFSLGSNLKSSTLKKEAIDIFVKAFKELSPIRVLWKWELDHLPGKSENVKIKKWLPQKDVLDQNINLKKCVEKGFGEALDFKTLTVHKVVTTIRKVLKEPSYLKNVQKASRIFKDQMESPLERAVYWTEYAIRHNGAPHLRHSSRNLSWYQNWMLDVIVFAFLFVVLFLYSIYKLFLICILHGNKTSKVKKN